MSLSGKSSAHAHEEAPGTPLRRALSLAIVLGCGLVFSSTAAVFVRNQERQKFEADFIRQTQIQSRAMQVAIREYEECLYTLRDLFNSSENVMASEFRRTSVDLRTRHRGLELLVYLQRVPHGERAAFEAAGNREDGRTFTIQESVGEGAGDGPLPEPSPAREEYLPVQYCDPVKGNEKMFGFDHLRGPYQETLARAVESGTVTATQRVTLGEGAGAEPGWGFALAVYDGEAEPWEAGERRSRLRGVLAGAVPFSDLLKETVLELPANTINLLLLDESAASEGRYLAHLTSGNIGQGAPPAEGAMRTGLSRAFEFSVAGRRWLALFQPSGSPGSIYPAAFLAFGIALTGVLAVLLHSVQRHALTVERLVDERTGELHEAKSALHEENERLREAEERYRTFVEQTNEAIWRFELSKPIPINLPEEEQAALYYERAVLAEASNIFAQMYGYERSKEMIGMRLLELMPRGPATFERLRQYVRSGYRMANVESQEIGRDGRRRIFLNNITGILEEGCLVRAWGMQRDVTAQHEAAEEKAKIENRLQEAQKLESLGVLAGGVAHDFNNLLTGILGNASLARMDTPEGSPVQNNLDAIEKTARRAAELCKQMLAYSGRGRFVVQHLDLSEIVEDTAHLLRPSISKNATVELDLARGLPAILADATQMRQITMNLVINASEALGDAAGTIAIRTGLLSADAAYLAGTTLSPDTPPGDYVFLEVSDTGCGMSAETRKKIFHPFFTTKFFGRGLGLAAVLGIVRGHGGALKVASEEGKGSTFTLLLPPTDARIEEPALEEPAPVDWRGSGTVLVVDDDEAVRTVAARTLQAVGYEIVLAVDGRDGVAKFRENPARFSAVLLDLTMPHMDGSAAFGEMRRIQPEIKVVLMSGFNEQDAISHFAGQGPAAFLQKPFETEELRQVFRKL